MSIRRQKIIDFVDKIDADHLFAAPTCLSKVMGAGRTFCAAMGSINVTSGRCEL